MKSIRFIIAIYIGFLITPINAIDEKPSFSSPRRPSGCIGEEGLPESAYDESLCHELRVLQEEFDQSELFKLSKSFENFVSHLKTFINETNFDVPKFQSQTKRLSVWLSELGTRAEEYSFDDSLRAQLLFIIEYFNVFQDSVKFMGCYKSMKLPGSILVYKVIELYVRTFALQNYYGEVDKSVRNYEEKVIEILFQLENYQKELEKLENVPFLIELMFHDQAGRIKRVIESLATRFLSLNKK